MINAVDKNKLKQGDRVKGNTHEDVKTSSIIENLLLLPDEMVINILRDSIGNRATLPKNMGKINFFEFWPSWNGRFTTKKVRVEPDVFIRFENCGLIIEAKRDVNAEQFIEQWLNEFSGCRNEYGSFENVYLIALDGKSDDMQGYSDENLKEIWNISRSEYNAIRERIDKCSWMNLLQSVRKERIGVGENYLNRIFDQIELAFEINGIVHVDWMKDSRLDTFEISHTSIEDMNKWYNLIKKWYGNK